MRTANGWDRSRLRFAGGRRVAHDSCFLFFHRMAKAAAVATAVMIDSKTFENRLIRKHAESGSIFRIKNHFQACQDSSVWEAV